MKFFNKNGEEIVLNKSAILPGYEVTLAEETIIDSFVDNPFFKGINILQISKKLKGFRNNSDLNKLLEPQSLDTGVKVESEETGIIYFEPKETLVTEKKLILVNHVFEERKVISPLFVNFGLKKVKLDAGMVIGTIFNISVNK